MTAPVGPPRKEAGASEAAARLTVLEVIRRSAAYLEEKGTPEPRLDAEHLLAGTLGVSRLELYLQHDRPLTPSEVEGVRERLRARGRREPLQYVLESAPFRGLELRVDRRVLIPRPETEVLVDEVLEWVSGQDEGSELEALEVGTGSGAVALALAVEGPFRRVVATDVSGGALAVARANARAAGIQRVEFREGSLLEPILRDERFHVLVSNPPYVALQDYGELQPEVREWEPREALVSGPEGTEVLDALVSGAARALRPGGLLALEVGEGQAGHVLDRIEATMGLGGGRVRPDLSGRERFVLAEARGSDGATERVSHKP